MISRERAGEGTEERGRGVQRVTRGGEVFYQPQNSGSVSSVNISLAVAYEATYPAKEEPSLVQDDKPTSILSIHQPALYGVARQEDFTTNLHYRRMNRLCHPQRHDWRKREEGSRVRRPFSLYHDVEDLFVCSEKKNVKGNPFSRLRHGGVQVHAEAEGLAHMVGLSFSSSKPYMDHHKLLESTDVEDSVTGMGTQQAAYR